MNEKNTEENVVKNWGEMQQKLLSGNARKLYTRI